MSEKSKTESIIRKLREIMETCAMEELDWSKYGPDSTIESLGLDSLTILDLLYDVEQELGVHLEARDIVSIRNMGEMASLLIDKGA
ncbi:MAG: hypothetical protein F7O42_01175 [Opitutae bacterium]|nr:hypothetical protein [Opitutae bacterium]